MAAVSPAAAPAAVDDVDPVERKCGLSAYDFKLQVQSPIVGVPIAGGQVQINAATAKIVASKATQTYICDTLLFRIPEFQWSVTQAPPGPSPSLTETNTLTPFMNLGGTGTHIVQFTACPNRCRLTYGGRSESVGPFRHSVVIEVATELPVPAETHPPPQGELPLARPQPPHQDFSSSRRSQMCLGGGGVKDPQWVTAGQFRGVSDYKLLQGDVTWSKVADLDNPLNHDTQDFEWKTQPDPPSFGLPIPEPDKPMKSEWESGSYPRIAQPTPGDRASTFGFRILDCGHDPYKAEIHPPVGVATHRPRAVGIPPSFRPPGFPNGFGSNVVVPGIVTDVWFNRRSGEITRNCSRTGLAQPAEEVRVRGQKIINRRGKCIRQPHPLNTLFKFNVYLPPNPKLKAEAAGITGVPDVPLWIGTEKYSEGGGGPEPQIEVREANGVTWLEVTLNLAFLRNEDKYGRRIFAAWAYPNQNNWGATRWNINLKDMKIYDDAEPGGDDGDWRVFFNTNNSGQEWSKIIDCDGCVDDGDTRKLNLRTGTRALGPDPIVFPGQPILSHVVGYDDEAAADDLGSILERLPQVGAPYSHLAQKGQQAYRLNYEVRPAGGLGPAALTPEAAALARAYTGKLDPQCRPVAGTVAQAGPRAPLCAPARQEPGLANAENSSDLILRKPVMRLKETEFDESHESETHALTSITVRRFRREILSLRPSGRRRVLREIKSDLADTPRGLRGDYNEVALTIERALPRRLERLALPRSLRRSAKRFRRRTRAFRRKRARQRARRRARARRRRARRRSAVAHAVYVTLESRGEDTARADRYGARP